jgi:hypothetical protein
MSWTVRAAAADALRATAARRVQLERYRGVGFVARVRRAYQVQVSLVCAGPKGRTGACPGLGPKQRVTCSINDGGDIGEVLEENWSIRV